MGTQKYDKAFSEVAGKTLESIKYEQNSDWQALRLAFIDGTLFSFEFSARATVEAKYLKARQGNLELIYNYGQVSAALGETE